MVTAQTTFSREQLLSLRNPMTLFGLNWEMYEEISDEIGKNRSLHVTFDRGTLTIMPITQLHELLIMLLNDLVTFTGVSTRTSITPTGQATIRSKRKMIGVEPDLSYFVTKAPTHRIKDYVSDEIETPPDIVVEIDVHHESDGKEKVYEVLGIPEYWHFNGSELKMYRLSESSTYDLVDRSSELRILTSDVLTRFLCRGRDGNEKLDILDDFQEWLRTAE